MLRRVCDTCERELPLTRFKPCGGGHYKTCRQCFTKRMRSRWTSPPQALRCRVCKRMTPLEECARDSARPYGRRRLCRPCLKERTSWANRTPEQRLAHRRAVGNYKVSVALSSEANSERPKPKIFDTRDFMPDAEALLRRGSAEGIAEAMRLAALRGIWEGYDRAMRSVKFYGAPPDVGELRDALMDVGMESKFLPSEATLVPLKREKRPKVIPEIYVDEPVGSLAEVEALAIRAALEATRGNKAEAARKLGIDRGSLYAKLRRLQETEEDPLEAEADAVLRAG